MRAVALIETLLFPVRLSMRFVDKVLFAEGRWERRQRRLMVEDRQPLADREFLRVEGASEADAPLWLAIRRSMADTTGLPVEAIRPEDRLDDLWRLQGWLAPDPMDFVFRLERHLGMKIPRAMLFEGEPRAGVPEEFGDFAARVIRALSYPRGPDSARSS